MCVNEFAVPIGRQRCIVGGRFHPGLEIPPRLEKSSSIERCAQSWNDGKMNIVVALKDSEWTAVTAEDWECVST